MWRPVPMKNIFVGNLDFNTSEEAVRQLFAVTKPRRKGLSGNVAPLSGQGRVFLARAGSPNHRNHELDDFHNSFLPAGRTKAGPDPAQPGSGGQGASVDR